MGTRQRSGPTRGGDDEHRMPRWVKGFLLAALLIVVLAVVVLALGGGDHGPARHLPDGEASAPSAPGHLLADRG